MSESVFKPSVASSRSSEIVMPRIGLTKLRRYPTMKRHLLGKMVRIFSHEWRMWWRKDGHGYTPNRDDAWVTRFEHAWDVSSHAGPEKGIEYEAA